MRHSARPRRYPGEIHRYGLPRSDLKVTLEGVAIKPAFALGGWVAFAPMHGEAMLMGDLVLLEAEITPVMTKLLNSGIDITAITAFNADTLVLGESLLGIDWVLGPSGRFARYAFNVVVSRILTPIERKRLRAIVEYLKPAHTHFVDLVEPFPPVIPDHWELGVSDLGETTDLH